jgi:hypothetical protein
MWPNSPISIAGKTSGFRLSIKQEEMLVSVLIVIILFLLINSSPYNDFRYPVHQRIAFDQNFGIGKPFLQIRAKGYICSPIAAFCPMDQYFLFTIDQSVAGKNNAINLFFCYAAFR